MAGQKVSGIGLIPVFIAMLNKVFIPRIGEIMKVMISKDLNDTAYQAYLKLTIDSF